MEQIQIIKPDDMHLHLRDGSAMRSVLPFSVKQVARAVVMPNLKLPVTSVPAAMTYKDSILAALPSEANFQPLMTLYLTDNTTEAIVYDAHKVGIIAFKLYPAGATTNSESGVTDLFKLRPTLEAMADCGMPLLVHGEVTDPTVDIFDREAVFIDKILQPLLTEIPKLKIVMEHITTYEAVKFVIHAPENVAATVTPQHLLFNRNHMLVGGMRPHLYCLPILKRAKHQQALVEAVVGEYAHRFFMGTDSAPHTRQNKECTCACAGVFSAHAAVELYAQAFEAANALNKLEAFTSINGARFYGLPINQEKITLIKQNQIIPEQYDFGEGKVFPLGSGEKLKWSLL